MRARIWDGISVAPETVRDAVISMDLSFLNPDTLEKLGKLQPQPAELATLKAFKGEVTELVEVRDVTYLCRGRVRCRANLQESMKWGARSAGLMESVVLFVSDFCMLCVEDSRCENWIFAGRAVPDA